MDVAALLLMVSGAGVGIGWQPMPDGSPRSELVLQIEPELIRTLAAEPSIPVVVEVPEDVGPIARVRLVVGDHELPRARIQVRAKPVNPTAAGDSGGVVLAQYDEPADGRYGAAGAAASPRSQTPEGTYDPYTEVPPEAARDWNNAGPAEGDNPLRAAAAPAVAETESAWNNGASAAQPAGLSPGPLRRLGEDVREAAQPWQQGIDRLGDRVRTAADNFNNRTGRLLDELGTGVGLQTPAAIAQAAPPAPPESSGGPAPAWNLGNPAGEQNDSVSARGDYRADEPPTSWNSADAAQGPPYGVDADSTASTSPSTVQDPWANAEDPRLRTGAAADASPPAADGQAGAAFQFPNLAPPQPRGQSATESDSAPPQLPGANVVQAPSIHSDAFNLPADRALEGADPLATASVPGGSIAGAPGGSAGSAPANDAPSAPADWRLDARPAGQPITTTQPASPASDARHKAAVILAWVLLSGSAAGNIYLFWSYLDVRTKYRALVRKTARAVGSRLAPA
jgi:hypothetical protein